MLTCQRLKIGKWNNPFRASLMKYTFHYLVFLRLLHPIYRYYPAEFKKYVQIERRDVLRRESFLQITLRTWKVSTKERKAKRIVLEKAVICKSFHILYSAFQILLKYSIWSISAQCIQRLVRRAIGRMELRFRLILFTRAVLIQSTFRSYVQRRNVSYIFFFVV